MKISLLLSFFLIIGLMASCGEMNTHPMDMTQAVQNAKTKADHEALAQHYEEAAEEMQAKVDEHKEILAHYRREPWLWGRRGESFEKHCQRLINDYEDAVQANRLMAEDHRAMAQ
ncbi:MAG: hypothetical protein ACU83O_02420 [Gammaproteobacteria bacterium]